MITYEFMTRFKSWCRVWNESVFISLVH